MYIINSAGIAYHQHEVLYIIMPQGDTRRRVMRYKGGLPPLMICTARCAAMICQACGLDKTEKESISTPSLFGAGKRTLNTLASLRWQDAPAEYNWEVIVASCRDSALPPTRGQEDLSLVAATQSREYFGFATLLGQSRL